MVQREQHACPEALDLQGAAELPAERVGHAVRRDDEERQVDENRDHSGEPDDHQRLPASVPPPGGDREQRDEHGGIELHGDARADDERGGT